MAPPRPLPHVDGVEHEYVALPGRDLRMHVALAGPPGGEPVVLLHGWPQHWYAWRHLIAPLAERHRVICPDLRGFGWSDAPAGSYEKATLAADVIALLDVLGLDRVRLAGHDWGGFTAFLVCFQAPERVSHLAAAGIPHPWVEREPGAGAALKAVRRLAYMALIAAPLLGRQVVRRVPGFTRAVVRASTADPDRTWTPSELEEFVAQWREPARAAACVAIYRSFLTRELKQLSSGAFDDDAISVPALILTGVADPVVRPDALSGFEAHAPLMDLVVLDEAGHWLPDEAPAAMAERLLTLFEREPPPAGIAGDPPY
jgi:pimeloyl-ACP methyl ester carboxylesterase